MTCLLIISILEFHGNYELGSHPSNADKFFFYREASYYVMRGIARLDHNDGLGRTVITSIHQPSSEVFQLFTIFAFLASHFSQVN